MVNVQLISALIFATQIVQSLYFLNSKCQALSHLLWLYSPEDRFSRDDIEAQIWFISVCRSDNKVGDQFTAAYTVHGASVGHTSLRAVTYLPDSRTVAGHAKPVEVSTCL